MGALFKLHLSILPNLLHYIILFLVNIHIHIVFALSMLRAVCEYCVSKYVLNNHHIILCK